MRKKNAHGAPTPGTKEESKKVNSGNDQMEISLIFPEPILRHIVRSGLRGLVRELEQAGEDPKTWVGFCYRETDWSFVKQDCFVNAD